MWVKMVQCKTSNQYLTSGQVFIQSANGLKENNLHPKERRKFFSLRKAPNENEEKYMYFYISCLLLKALHAVKKLQQTRFCNILLIFFPQKRL